MVEVGSPRKVLEKEWGAILEDDFDLDFSSETKGGLDVLKTALLNTDLRHVKGLSSTLEKTKTEATRTKLVNTPVLCQVLKATDAAQPQNREATVDVDDAPHLQEVPAQYAASAGVRRVLVISAAIGALRIAVVEASPISELSLKTLAPGIKFLIFPTPSRPLQLFQNVILVHPGNIRLLGGHVESLENAWKTKNETAAFRSGGRSAAAEKAPSFVSFSTTSRTNKSAKPTQQQPQQQQQQQPRVVNAKKTDLAAAGKPEAAGQKADQGPQLTGEDGKDAATRPKERLKVEAAVQAAKLKPSIATFTAAELPGRRGRGRGGGGGGDGGRRGRRRGEDDVEGDLRDYVVDRRQMRTVTLADALNLPSSSKAPPTELASCAASLPRPSYGQPRAQQQLYPSHLGSAPASSSSSSSAGFFPELSAALTAAPSPLTTVPSKPSDPFNFSPPPASARPHFDGAGRAPRDHRPRGRRGGAERGGRGAEGGRGGRGGPPESSSSSAFSPGTGPPGPPGVESTHGGGRGRARGGRGRPASRDAGRGARPRGF